MSYADINKWINGETDVFDRRQIPPPLSDSNAQNESPAVRSSFWRFLHPAIGIVVGTLSVATVIGLILARYSVEPFPTAPKAQHSANSIAAMDVSRPPKVHWRTFTLSDAGLTAFLKDWIDPSLSPSVASSPLPPRELVTRPTSPEPSSEGKPEDPPRTAPESLARAPRLEKLGRTPSADESSRPQSTKFPSHPLWSDSVARLPMSEASSLTQRANAFMNSYWQTVDESGDRVLPYLSSIYAPMVTYYGKLLPKQTVLRDKYYFLKRWPIHQTWSSPEAESPSISCSEVAAECEISGIRKFNAISAERRARAAGVVRYRYGIRFLDRSPQIVAEHSEIVAHD
jgi:hypothetical protein